MTSPQTDVTVSPATDEQVAAIRTRNDKRKKDPRVHYQWGCAGTHRGRGTKECPAEPHHHHDDRCDPPATVDADSLLSRLDAEVLARKKAEERVKEEVNTRIEQGNDLIRQLKAARKDQIEIRELLDCTEDDDDYIGALRSLRAERDRLRDALTTLQHKLDDYATCEEENPTNCNEAMLHDLFSELAAIASSALKSGEEKG